MSTPKLDISSKDDESSLNVLRNTDIAQLLLVSRTFVLDCWPAEEFALKNGKANQKSARSLLHGALVRIAATGLPAQIAFGYQNAKGRRVLALQALSKPSQATTQVSIHDIMDRPWPTTLASKKAFEKALADALNSQRIKAMNVKEVASTLHRLEQAKYWSNLKEKHNSQSLAAKQRSAIEGQMADCMRSADAAPAAELLAMVQAACEEEEPGEVSDGRRALRRHLQEVKDRQQLASRTALASAASATTRTRSVGSSPENHPRRQNKAPGPSAIRDKGLGESTGQGDRPGADAAPSPRGAVEVRVTVTKASESHGDSEGRVKGSCKPSGGVHDLSQSSASRDEQSGGRRPSSADRREHLLQGEPTKHAPDSKAAQRQRRPPSASTPGKLSQTTPGTSPGNGHMSTPKTIPAAKHDAASRTALQPDASKSVSQHQPVAESPGIITSVTIARLASHSAPQPALNGKVTTGVPAPTGTATCTAGSKRKNPDTPHQLSADSSNHAHPSNPALPPSTTLSPSSSSPGAKRKKIMWDPKLVQAPAPWTHGLRFPALSGRLQDGSQPAQTMSVNLSHLPSAPQVQHPLQPRDPALAATQQPPDQQAVGRSARTDGVRASQEVAMNWSWGPGAAVKGHFNADLVSMMPRSVDERQSGQSTKNAVLTLSRVIYLASELQQLGRTTCKGVYLVHCKGQRLCGCHTTGPLAAASPESKEAVVSCPGECSVGSIAGLMEHARLWGCLE